MKRLEAAESNITTAENIIQSERQLRKGSSKQLKQQIKDLEALVQKEKRTLSDKVSAELDSTLKYAVKEKVEIKRELDEVKEDRDRLSREYEDLVSMYDSLKQQEAQSQKLADESQKIISDLEDENRNLKQERGTLQKSNLERTTTMDAANKNYDEIRSVVYKLDEARVVMNRLMGPGGVMGQDQRQRYLSGNVAENDQMAAQAQSPAAIGYKPQRQPSGLQSLSQNPSSKNYFNNAGIGGQSPYAGQVPQQ